MKSILGYFTRFWKKDFDPLIYGLTALGLVIAISLNYSFDFEDSILDSQHGKWYSWPFYFFYFAGAYFFVILLYYLLRKETRSLFTNRFWMKSLFILLLLSFKSYFYFHQLLPLKSLPYQDYYAAIKIINRLVNLSIYIFGLVLFYKFLEVENKTWYGITRKGFNWKPYLVMLLVMVPLIGWASTQADFLEVYPKFRPEYFQTNYWKYFAVFEPLYLGEFIMVEWVFRGFLIVGMVKLLGHRAILPMVVLYCVFHFGKPLGECIGSIFGGYILGVIAYYSRSIWGGILIHMGIAALMDAGAIISGL